MKVMKHAWRHGTAPTCTAEVPEFVERHVHDNYVLTAGVKSLPIHRHLLHVEKPTILRKPPHTVHKTLRGGGGSEKKWDRISGHPYAIASSRRRTDDYYPKDDDSGGDEDSTRQTSSSSIPSMFGVTGVIGGPEFDPYQHYRHSIFPFKEQLAHEVNKLVLEKEKLDKLRKQASAAVAAAASRHHQHHHHHDDDTDSCTTTTYDDDDTDGTDTLVDDDDDQTMLSSSSTLVDDDDENDEDEILD